MLNLSPAVAAPVGPLLPVVPQATPLGQNSFVDGKLDVNGSSFIDSFPAQSTAPIVQPSPPFHLSPSLQQDVVMPKMSDSLQQQLLVYPGDPCSSTSPQIPVRGALNGANVSRPPFPSTSYCAPRFKRKLRGAAAGDGGAGASTDESDAVRGKIFVTEQMVTRMGDLSLNDQRLKGGFLTTSSETDVTLPNGRNDHLKAVEGDDSDDDVNSNSKPYETLRICDGLKSAITPPSSSSIEERLAQDM